jgi:diacylglycerol kinase (ATP)
MKYSFIINPNSGNNRKKNIIYKLLNNYPSDKIAVTVTEYAGHAAELAQQELNKGTANIIAVGGDGTVNEIASQLVGSDAHFGIIPMGSGNGFARAVNIPLRPQDALDTVFRNKSKRIDVGKVNDKFFFAVAGLGLDANIAFQFQESKIRGAFPYFIAGFKEFFRYSYPEFKISNNNNGSAMNPLIITIANGNQFGNGAKIAPHADLQDGLLDICVLQKMSLITSFNAVIKMFQGKIDHIPGYVASTSKRVEITSEKKEINYHVDGEPFKTGDKLIFEILPKSLNVITI